MPTADAEPGIGTEPLAPVSENQPQGERAVSVLWSFGKCLGALLPVYLAGYYGFSVTIVLFGLVIYMGWKHGRQGKVMRLKSAMYLLENEKEFTTQTVFRAKRDLPPWVSTDTPSVMVILCRVHHTPHLPCQADTCGNIIHFYSSSSENTKSGRLLLHGTLTNRSDS